ncbi:MAG: urea carboxylase-associated family protein [Phenylobacterium sp.]|uniref:urea amidolyase associated protein UAAP1 n=1 Tax=Phenylobacterium sp. TaxID=1871053 RepID=UPI002735A3C4|nr:urea amidolyase associated protein UAAP1 [Phenylobacterium sp.]MDP3174322.1 urea carboxylase-associated family protein [Phenylobacterium sp.]
MSTVDTSDPKAAQAHARSMGGTRVEAMPFVPAAEAPVLPHGVAPSDMLWAETVAAGGYTAKILGRGARLRLTDLNGEACASMLAFSAERPSERLNVADTLKVQWNAYLGAGKLLLSDMGRVMFSILEDTAQTHDAFCGASNAASNARRYGDGDNWGDQPNARDRFKLAVAKFGLGARDIHPCINWFKGVRVEPDGQTTLQAGPFVPARQVTLRVEADVIVVLANCPHVLDPRADYTVTPLGVAAWRGPVTPTDDPIRNATPEGLRAFLNLEDHLRR